jgi:hypothetical protein
VPPAPDWGGAGAFAQLDQRAVTGCGSQDRPIVGLLEQAEPEHALVPFE